MRAPRDRFYFDGVLLRQLREGRGWKLRDLEKRTGLSNAFLSQLETRKVANPGLAALYAIAEAFNMNADSFVLRLS